MDIVCSSNYVWSSRQSRWAHTHTHTQSVWRRDTGCHAEKYCAKISRTIFVYIQGEKKFSFRLFREEYGYGVQKVVGNHFCGFTHSSVHRVSFMPFVCHSALTIVNLSIFYKCALAAFTRFDQFIAWKHFSFSFFLDKFHFISAPQNDCSWNISITNNQ